MTKYAKRMIALALTFLMVISLSACGGGSTGTSGGSSSAPNVEQNVDVALSEEEFVFHGVHMRIPNVFEMIENENVPDYYSSQWKGTPPQGYQPGSIDFELFYNDEFDTWDTSVSDEYSPYSARIYLAEGDFESRGADDWTYERVRLSGVDALIRKREKTAGEGQGAAHGTDTHIYLILESSAVLISYYSLTEQFDKLFEEAISSMWVDEEEIPDLVKRTEPDALTEAGLMTNAWEYNGLYMHMPVGYTLVETGNKGPVWISDNGASAIYLLEGEKEQLGYDEAAWEGLLSGMEGFQELRDVGAGVMHGMYYSYVSYLYTESDQQMRGDWIVLLPKRYGSEKTVILTYLYPADDTETDELGTRMLDTVHCADGWVGDGLLDVEPVSLDEFKEAH